MDDVVTNVAQQEFSNNKCYASAFRYNIDVRTSFDSNPKQEWAQAQKPEQ